MISVERSDTELLDAILNERDPEQCALRIGEFYHDADRARRISRELLYLHMGMLVGCAMRLAQRAQVLTERDAAKYLALLRPYLRKARRVGGGPAFIQVGRAVRYRVADLDHFLYTRRVETRESHGVKSGTRRDEERTST